MAKLEDYRKLYGFNSGALDWIPNGGDLLEHVGQEVMFVEFFKKNEGWSNKFHPVVINAIGDYDPITLTYQIDYTIDGEKKTQRITPEGFSLEILGQGLQNYMNRFIPFSLHLACVERDASLKRILRLWDERKTLTFEQLRNIANSKEQKKMLEYALNIQCVIRPYSSETTDKEVVWENEVLCFRIVRVTLRHIIKDIWRVSLYDSNGKSTTLEISENDNDFYEMDSLGDIKIIDLSSNGEEKEASSNSNEKERED